MPPIYEKCIQPQGKKNDLQDPKYFASPSHHNTQKSHTLRVK